MPRIIPLSVQNLVNAGEGIDPILIVGITFGNTEMLYADRDLGDPLNPGVKGKILELGQLEDVTRIDGNGSSTSISFKLDDSDGSIKAILDVTDVIFHRVTVYQFFDGLSIFSDLILLFEGVLASPIEWDEGTRTISATAITRQSNWEVGFSLDESNVPVYHQSLLNQAWPMVFGSPIYTDTLLLQEIPIGYLVNAFILPDPSIPAQLISLQNQMQVIANENSGIVLGQSVVIDSFGNTAPSDADWQEYLPQYLEWISSQLQRIDAARLEIANLQSQYAQQLAKYLSTNMVVGGYRFPQGIPLICKINERTFKITFLGGNTLPTNPEQPCPISLEVYESPYIFTPLNQQTPQQQRDAAALIVRDQELASQLGVNNFAQLQLLIDSTPLQIERAGAELFEEGSTVELLDNLPGGYWHVASIIPGTVQGVYAYRTVNGYRRLAQVPEKYYSIRTVPMSPVQGHTALMVTYIILLRPLSTVSYFDNLVTTPYDLKLLQLESSQNQLGVSRLTNKIEWEDEVYVNFISSVGPNTVDIIIWLIQHYTLYTFDPVSFTKVRANVDPFPANFVLTNRPVVDTLIQDIAYQSRCAVWIKNGVYYIKYLPIQPVTTSTITDDDIDFGSLKITSTSTDNLITKYVAKWKPDGVHPDNSLVVKNNVEKYGIIEESHDFFIYNNYAQVLKAATFWLIRRSNVWKIVNCNLHLTRLDIETLDDVLLDLTQPLVTIDPDGIPCQVESCSYDSDSNLISVSLWTGIKFGEMLFYAFAHPSTLPANFLYPLYTELYTGALPIIPSELYSPLLPYYNNIHSILSVADPNGFLVDPNGFISKNGPSVKGDSFPSDDADRLVQPSYFKVLPSVTASSIPLDNTYVYTPIPAGTNFTGTDLVSKSYPGRVSSRDTDGTWWNVNTYPNGLDSPSVSKRVREVHGDPNLVGIEGEWVTVYNNPLPGRQREYLFATQHTMAFPILMDNKTTGDIYTQGSSNLSITEMPVGQIQIATGYDIPAGTWTIGVRVWNGNVAKYEVQIPVWLPKP